MTKITKIFVFQGDFFEFHKNSSIFAIVTTASSRCFAYRTPENTFNLQSFARANLQSV